MADFIGASVSARIPALFTFLQDDNDAGSKGRLKRSSALQPMLVFVMEKLEAALIRANKSMSGVNLVRNFVRGG